MRNINVKCLPLYTYWCKKCEKLYEVMIKLKDYGTEVKCPHCKKTTEKIITPVRFSIK